MAEAISYAIDKQAMLDLRGGPIAGDIAGHALLDSLEKGYLARYDAFPTSLAAAREEMARSAYDDDRDGRCDHAVCEGLLMLSSKGYFPEMGDMAASVRQDLRGIGIELRIKTIKDYRRSYDAISDPYAKVPLAIFPSWLKDFLNASSFVTPLFSIQAIGSYNFSLVGATSAQLKKWGYDVTSVPGIDETIDKCRALVGDLQVRCWVETDQLLMTKVIPWVPYIFENKVQLVSDRVVANSTSSLPHRHSIGSRSLPTSCRPARYAPGASNVVHPGRLARAPPMLDTPCHAPTIWHARLGRGPLHGHRELHRGRRPGRGRSLEGVDCSSPRDRATRAEAVRRTRARYGG